MRTPALLLLALAAATAGCALPAEDAERPDDPPAGPRFVLVLQNEVPREVVARLHVTGPFGNENLDATVVGAASAATEERLPLAFDGSHVAAIDYEVQGGGHASTGRTEARFDTTACGEGQSPRVVVRTFERDGTVYASTSSTCAA